LSSRSTGGIVKRILEEEGWIKTRLRDLQIAPPHKSRERIVFSCIIKNVMATVR
jgi:hypothetical protein